MNKEKDIGKKSYKVKGEEELYRKLKNKCKARAL